MQWRCLQCVQKLLFWRGFEGCGSYATETAIYTATVTRRYGTRNSIWCTAAIATSTAPVTAICAGRTATSRCRTAALQPSRSAAGQSRASTSPTTATLAAPVDAARWWLPLPAAHLYAFGLLLIRCSVNSEMGKLQPARCIYAARFLANFRWYFMRK